VTWRQGTAKTKSHVFERFTQYDTITITIISASTAPTTTRRSGESASSWELRRSSIPLPSALALGPRPAAINTISSAALRKEGGR
jgi:hypothetical protein